LKIETRSPGEIAANFQIFTLAMPVHVGGQDPFGWLGIMGAAGGMDMVVTRPPAEL
jgi:hypothetical protein